MFKVFFKNNGALFNSKVERKNKLFNLKHEIILGQKEKKRKLFQVKVISKDLRKMIVPSFMFLFNLSKSVAFCMKKMLI